MRTIITSDTTDRLLPLDVTCQCPGGTRVPPIRVTVGLLALLERANGEIDPNMLLQTYRCGSCQSVVLIRARHLRNGSA